MPIFKYADEKKILLIYFFVYIFHLLQPLDIGLFGLFQYAYIGEVGRLAQLGFNYINKFFFLEIFIDVRIQVYTNRNVRGAWRGNGIKSFNLIKPFSIITRAHPIIFFFFFPPLFFLRTPRTVFYVDKVLDAFFEIKKNPRTVQVFTKLTRETKIALIENILQVDKKQILLEINKYRKPKKRKMTIIKNKFLTSDRVNKIIRIIEKKRSRKIK